MLLIHERQLQMCTIRLSECKQMLWSASTYHLAVRSAEKEDADDRVIFPLDQRRAFADDERRERDHGCEDGVAARDEYLGRLVLSPELPNARRRYDTKEKSDPKGPSGVKSRQKQSRVRRGEYRRRNQNCRSEYALIIGQ